MTVSNTYHPTGHPTHYKIENHKAVLQVWNHSSFGMPQSTNPRALIHCTLCTKSKGVQPIQDQLSMLGADTF